MNIYEIERVAPMRRRFQGTSADDEGVKFFA